MHSHVQRLPGFPEQNNTDSRIKFYVDYLGGGTMRQDILQLIVNVQLQSVESDAGFNLTLVPIIKVPEVTPPSDDNINNSISVILKNFQADQVCCSNICRRNVFKLKRKAITWNTLLPSIFMAIISSIQFAYLVISEKYGPIRDHIRNA